MKGILVVIDGIGDFPCRQLDGKTPLEAAETPNLDFLATRGEMGYMYPVRPGFIPESEEAIVSIFGNELIDSTRGQLEARGTDIKLTRGDLALRTNFATIDNLKEGNINDRRAGRTLTTAEAEELAKALNKIKMPCKFIFKPTVQHRGVLVFRGGFSDNITGNDSTYSKGEAKEAEKIGIFKALDDDENSQYTVNILREFINKAFGVLDNHPVNKERKRKGLLPANYLLVRGAGIEPPKLKYYKRWLSVVYMPLETGFSKVSGMNIFSFDYPRLKSLDSYENLRDGLEKACGFSIKVLKKNHKNADYAYIHIKETDLPGHDNKPVEKKLMIEYIDKTLFKFLKEFAPPKRIKVVVTADHSTPSRLKAHSSDPVPVLFYSGKPPGRRKRITAFFKTATQKIPLRLLKEPEKKEKGEKFCEKNARKGDLGRIMGKELLEKVGFLR
jgi:2,3-bisphosphoglycerate-independent phosphoglycerate mutase